MVEQGILFYIIAAFTGLSALAVLVSQNIVRSAVWLLFTLAGTAGVIELAHLLIETDLRTPRSS